MKFLFLVLVALVSSSCIYEKEQAPTYNADYTALTTEVKVEELVIFPHSPEFKNALNHGKLFLKNKNSCTKCHDTSGEQPSEIQKEIGPSCTSCHTAYPHIGSQKKDWTGSHGKFFKKNYKTGDETTNTCTKCHNSEILEKSAGLTKLSCNSCHVQMPHDNNNWIYYSPTNEHHADFLKTNGVSDCRKCHGPDIKQEDVSEHNQGKAQFCSKCHQ